MSCPGQLIIEGSRNRQCQEIWFPPSWNPRDSSILSKFTIYTRSYECRLQKLAVPWQKDLHSFWQCLVFCLPDINMFWSPVILSKDLAPNLINVIVFIKTGLSGTTCSDIYIVFPKFCWTNNVISSFLNIYLAANSMFWPVWV